MNDVDSGRLDESEVTRVRIELTAELDPTVGYASVQNDVPVIRSLRIVNSGALPVRGCTLTVTCDPPFARNLRLLVDILGAGEVRTIEPVDLPVHHAYLADLNEATNAFVEIRLSTEEDVLASITLPIEVLAYDQWPGTKSLPELLAAFGMPNNPAVDVMVGKASTLLRRERPELAMDGYSSHDRAAVWAQVSALYSTLRAENLQYALPPASFGTQGQRIRTPDRILDGRVGTCLDLTMLFCSCLEQMGLHSVVLLREGHSWAGVWLHETEFSYPLIDDAREVRKRVDSGELLVFETTGIALDAGMQPSLRAAREHAYTYLQDTASFHFLIDVSRARQLRIKPLPSRGATVLAPAGVPLASAAHIESVPELPPYEPVSGVERRAEGPETSGQRLQRWQSRLLDLTRRNRLLNFKSAKATLQLAVPDLAALEDQLAEGLNLKLRGLPELMTGADPRDGRVYRQRHGVGPLVEFVGDASQRGELVFDVNQEALQGKLQAIHLGARTSLEEGGSNTLYLAIGMLRWTETPTAEKASLAPILLVPVTLTRRSVSSGYRLSRHDDETMVNRTLLEYLKQKFEIIVPMPEPLPTDSTGVDVDSILQVVRHAVAEQRGWEVITEAHLGLFSFTKYLMWKDLKDRVGELLKNRVVGHLIEHPGEVMPRSTAEEIPSNLDARDPCSLVAPKLADSSQLRALAAVDAGLDLVLEGPPGTGKSQTITNLIANALSKGKSVLFVSEKMAALSVVHRRLEDVGLGPFCLELHSAKAQKAEVLKQMQMALDAAGSRSAAGWKEEGARLLALRTGLNHLVGLLHQRHPNGLTVFEAIGKTVGHPESQMARFMWRDASSHDRSHVSMLHDLARQVDIALERVGNPARHPLRRISARSWSPGWQSQMLDSIDGVLQAIDGMVDCAGKFCGLMTLDAGLQSRQSLTQLDELADRILAAPALSPTIMNAAASSEAQEKLLKIASRGAKRGQLWATLEEVWNEELTSLDAADLSARWNRAASDWWPKSWFAKRAVTQSLDRHRRDGSRTPGSAIPALLDTLAGLNREDAFVHNHHSWLSSSLQALYDGSRTDWNSVLAQLEWMKSVRATIATLEGTSHEALMGVRQAILGASETVPSILTQRQAFQQESASFRRATSQLTSALSAFEALAEPVAGWSGPSVEGGFLQRLTSSLVEVQEARRDLQPWCKWQGVRATAVSEGLEPLLTLISEGMIQAGDGASQFDVSYANWWLKHIVDRTPELANYSGAEHAERIRDFRRADEQFQKLSIRYAVAQMCAKVPAPGILPQDTDSELGRLSRELAKTRRHLPVRQLIDCLPTLLPRLKPCLLMSPLSIAQYLPASRAKFDLVVFDEASQIPVWDAVGAIARGSQVVVVGDPKQLPPTSFFTAAVDEEGDGADDQIEDLESILDECLAVRMQKETLDWHYRSLHESLITFSNVRYYDSRLITFPSPATADRGVSLVWVDGVYDRGGSRTNRREAEAVVEAIAMHYLSSEIAEQSVGVVTFNIAQQALIEKLLDARRLLDGNLDRVLAERTEEPLFIKNLENVQGDERDLIYFSTTYGKDASGRMSMNFGPLNGSGGHRRLNVAITRARVGVVLYTSLEPEAMDLSKIRSAGVRDLKNYLEFARHGVSALVSQSLPTDREPDSPFEREVAAALTDNGWEIHPQVGCSSYRIDIGVVDPRSPGRYLAGVECDGATYHSAATARDRDRLRQLVLERLGWKLIRIWSTDWWLNPARELDRVHRLLKDLESSDPSETSVLRDEPSISTAQVPIEAERYSQLPTTAEGASRTALPLFSESALTGGDPEAFYDDSSLRSLRAQALQVIQQEGPVLEKILIQRVARAWGLQRTGARITDRLLSVIPKDLRRTEKRPDRFVWPEDKNPETWAGFRIGNDDASRRPVQNICLEELANMARYALQHSGATPVESLARTVCKMAGMERVPADAQRRAQKAIRKLIDGGQVYETPLGLQIASDPQV